MCDGESSAKNHSRKAKPVAICESVSDAAEVGSARGSYRQNRDFLRFGESQCEIAIKNGGFSEMETSIQEHENNLFAQIKRDKGRLDVVFANASIAEPAPIGESHGRAV